MAAPQQQLQSPAQLRDRKTHGFSTAGSNQTPDLQAGPLGAASQQLAGHGPHSPTPNYSAAAENGPTDLTPQDDSQPNHTVNSAMSTSIGTTTEFGKATLSAEERDRLAAEWKANGKPSCPSCKKMHPPPCDTARVQELAGIKALRDDDPEAYKRQIAAFQAKYSKNESTQKRKAASSGDTEMTNRAAPAAKKRRRGYFNLRLCNTCQEYHPFGKHTKTKQEARDLVNRQLQGLAPIPQFAAIKAAKDELREYKIANLRRGQLSTGELIRQYDRRRADQRERERALVGHAPAMFAHMLQQQGPEAGFNFLAGFYKGTVTQFPAQLQYPMPTYGYQAQSQQPMPTYGYQVQPQQSMPTYGYHATTYPASAYPSAQHQAPQAPHAQDTTPQPPMQYYGAPYGVPPDTRYDARPTAPPTATKAPARAPRDATERRESRTSKDKA